LGVGLILAVLLCIQCTRSSAFRAHSLVRPASAWPAGGSADERVRRLEKLAATDHVALLKLALEHYRDNYQDYTCTFIKQERIHGRLLPEEWVGVKFAERPFSVVMAWIKNPARADRILYVKGKYNGQMLIRPHGWFAQRITGGTATRDPESKEVLANTLRPVTMFGFRRCMESLLRVYELAESRGEARNRFCGYSEVAGRRALVLERRLPLRKDYPARTTIWYLDVQHLVPLGLMAYDWDEQLTCSYLYKDIRFNVGLDEEDFAPEANGMKLQE
jgi:hypothetical protein